MVEPTQIHFNSLEQMLFSGSAIKRLLMACGMGGAIGLERESRHKDSGLRTNMLICMVLAGDSTANKGQVAANIVQGIGFLGAGLILHGRNRVLGLTSAATVFVVAAIGMTCGDGLYLVALIATILLLLSLQLVGAFESSLGWKRYPMIYEVRADVGTVLSKDFVGQDRAEAMAEDAAAAQHRMQRAILRVLDAAGQRLIVQERDTVAGMERMSFVVTTTRKIHKHLVEELRASDATDQVVVFRDMEEE
jgi:putative Mg2+ transporter-C (MgtC) family protein